MSEVTAVIEIKDLWFAYTSAPILENVNLAVPSRDFACIVGPNGGGKSTLLKLILGLIQPGRGTVRVFGRPPGDTPQRIGYMPQYTAHDQQFPVTVMDVVLMGALRRDRLAGGFTAADRAAAVRALEEVSMAAFQSRPFTALSGGQRQRVLIARSIVSAPDLLLLDEPTSNVDIAVEREFYELLKVLNRRMTVVIVSHDLGFVSSYVKSVICVNRRVHIHPTAELNDHDIRNIYGMDMQLVQHDHR